ncbi:MAG: hypothetical protein IJE63_04835 [Clostridia bacterium]|nr:hypothetical protein [Clostridia bacterium]
MYMPIFFMMLFKVKDAGVGKRFLAPAIAIIGCCFMMVATVFSHQKFVIGYLIIFTVIMAVGMLFSKEKKGVK